MIFPAIPPRLLLAWGALAALLAAGWYLHHSGYKSGQAAVQALWDADKVVAAKAVLDAASRADDIRRADAATSKQVQHDLQARATASDARNAALTRRLRDYERRACDRPVSGATFPAPGADAAAPEPGSDSGIGAAVAAVVSACRADSARLDAWIDWWSGIQDNR